MRRSHCPAPVVALQVPPPIRAIFATWSEPGDPAPLHAGEDPASLAQFYARLASAAPALYLARHARERIHRDAAHNMVFGQFAELRREGAIVYRWIAALVSTGAVTAQEGRAPPGTT